VGGGPLGGPVIAVETLFGDGGVFGRVGSVMGFDGIGASLVKVDLKRAVTVVGRAPVGIVVGVVGSVEPVVVSGDGAAGAEIDGVLVDGRVGTGEASRLRSGRIEGVPGAVEAGPAGRCVVRAAVDALGVLVDVATAVGAGVWFVVGAGVGGVGLCLSHCRVDSWAAILVVAVGGTVCGSDSVVRRREC